MGLISDLISSHLGWLSWIPGMVMVVQAFLSLLLIIFTLIAVILFPGKILKIASLIIGFVLIIIVWFM